MWVDTLQKEALLEWNVAGITETSSFPGEKKIIAALVHVLHLLGEQQHCIHEGLL